VASKLFYNCYSFAELFLLNSICGHTLFKSQLNVTWWKSVTRVLIFQVKVVSDKVPSTKFRYFDSKGRNFASSNYSFDKCANWIKGLDDELKQAAWVSIFLIVSHDCKQSLFLLSTLATVWLLCHTCELLPPLNEESRGTFSGGWPWRESAKNSHRS